MDIEQVALFDLYLKSIPKYGLKRPRGGERKPF